MGSQKYSHGKAHLCRESLIRNPRWLPQLLQSFLLGFYNPQYDDVTSVWYLSQATLVISQSFLLIHHCRLLFEWSLTICCFSLSVPSYLILYSCLWCWEHNRKVSDSNESGWPSLLECLCCSILSVLCSEQLRGDGLALQTILPRTSGKPYTFSLHRDWAINVIAIFLRNWPLSQFPQGPLRMLLLPDNRKQSTEHNVHISKRWSG